MMTTMANAGAAASAAFGVRPRLVFRFTSDFQIKNPTHLAGNIVGEATGNKIT
jgi:hypothetical protein